ncbi:MAG: sulfatase-like hydrolase/transferase [Planctomycetaceae bacterium]|jgi:arylsulfatase A-like enzyme|nr:sulfatase-like hydrolase/transferase [Planctomycetaceae bacterium]
MKQLFFATVILMSSVLFAGEKPNIVFVMTDDQGWGETGYQTHPVLKTPNLDKMAESGLRFNRFYSGGPVCSPTRACVLTGRTHDRCGVLNHGYSLRLQEKTLAQALKNAGYITGHFGKWHLNGFSGPGVPILADDNHNPGCFGFDSWVSVTNFFDLNPLMSRKGTIEEFSGDSSDVTVNEAVKFMKTNAKSGKPMFVLIWFGSPHLPAKALDQDKAAFKDLDAASANHYGELVAMDRSIGTLRRELREMGLAGNTLLFFCSDNGGLPGMTPETVGGLRGYKGSLFEGGIRVPGIIEWPAVIKPRITNYPVCVTDMFPTIVDLLGLPNDSMILPIDGISLKPLFEKELTTREKPLGFRYQEQQAWIENRYKIVKMKGQGKTFQLFDLEKDPHETTDIIKDHPEIAKKMKADFELWNASIDASFAGQDYPEKKLTDDPPPQRRWTGNIGYQPYLNDWKKRWEYQKFIK